MPTHHNVSQAAAIVGISPSSIRSWCTQFSRFLSAGATPPTGVERALSNADIGILQHIAQLRKTGASYESIAQSLSEIDTEALQPFVEAVATTPIHAPAPPTASPTDGLQIASAFLLAIESRTAPIDARIDQLKAESQGKITIFVLGFLCGLATALVAVAAILLGARV